MFFLESQMMLPAARWLEAEGMVVKNEFITPWGKCDLVGAKFNRQHVEHRLSLRQFKKVSSITRAALLLQIPEVESHKSTSLKRLVDVCSQAIPPDVIETELAKLISDHFVVSNSRGRLQKKNGWLPLQERLVAIELKLSRIEEAMAQALNNLGFADESYVALPTEVARRVKLKCSKWSRYFDSGVGLLGISSKKCEVITPSRQASDLVDPAVQLYCVEKFWSRSLRDN